MSVVTCLLDGFLHCCVFKQFNSSAGLNLNCIVRLARLRMHCNSTISKADTEHRGARNGPVPDSGPDRVGGLFYVPSVVPRLTGKEWGLTVLPLSLPSGAGVTGEALLLDPMFTTVYERRCCPHLVARSQHNMNVLHPKPY